MEEREYIIELYEIYKKLLTSKQIMYFENYYYEDLSLNEISSNNKVSKAMVSKNINNTINKLRDYESKLKIHFKEKKLIDGLKDKNNLLNIVEEILYKD
jgi:predicted DNA-binding protein YlxM (UPF0122 family)